MCYIADQHCDPHQAPAAYYLQGAARNNVYHRHHHTTTQIPRPAWNPHHPFTSPFTHQFDYGLPPYPGFERAASALLGSFSLPALPARTTIKKGLPKEVPTAFHEIEDVNPELAAVYHELSHAYWSGRFSSAMDRWSELNPQLSEERRVTAVLAALEKCCESEPATRGYWRWRGLLEWRWGVNVAGRGVSGGTEEEGL
jgi:hypothetical protein